ncbi:DNA-directed RNA polymerase subunit omega [Wolbachia endosymbiont of Chironomus riparius]|uniref:DNA-directed RNA polymerase subunit omega n=1 Tax=Wolbachia endosymbiont of Chironomus riparius TaxID=2883238 RepID=UPI0020A1465E|nr:DNA-directed RNA polymerase subunit omega [Wolbachia endosymbiont of Chironomus riparius]
MVEFTVEKCVEQVSNSFKLVLLASQRVHDLNTGAGKPDQTAKLKNRKNTTIALREIANKKVCVYNLFNLLVTRCRSYVKGNLVNSNKEESSKYRIESKSTFI